MSLIQDTFFELLQIAFGSKQCLSYTPNDNDWCMLYQIAEKQSLVGISFAAFDCLHIQHQIPPMDLLMDWLGQAEYMKSTNGAVNSHCAELQAKLTKDGFKPCVLKGQGVAQLYPDHLRELRQSGDIDVWLDGGIESALYLSKLYSQTPDVTEQHIHLQVFDDTDVEVHFRPSILRNPFANALLQKWFVQQKDLQFQNRNEKGLCVPTHSFNIVYLLIHIYRHLFGEGVGMRQVMDYYCLIKNLHYSHDCPSKEYEESIKMISALGLQKFAGAIMWIFGKVFCMDRSEMICKPNERHGRFLLNEIMLAGNFGHFDERLMDKDRTTRLKRFLLYTSHNLRLITYYPSEVLWAPYSRVKIWCWRKRNGWI